MRCLVLAVLLLVCFVSRTHAHAKLTSPVPWAVYESLTPPCGGPLWANNTAPWAQWVINSTASISWVVADNIDGLGQVSLTFEQVPTNFFNVPSSLVTLWLPNTTWTVGDFVLRFEVPELNCMGPNSTCIVQTLQHGQSSFIDCTTVKVVSSGSNFLLNPLGGDSLCQQAYPQMCPNAQYQLVSVPNDTTLADLSLAVTDTLAILNDPQSIDFHNPSTSGCSTAFLAYLCAYYFQPCNSPSTWAPLGVCASSCNQAMCLCGLDKSQYEGDYDCGANAQLPSTSSDSNGPCNTSYSRSYSLSVSYPTCAKQSNSGFALLPSLGVYCGGILLSILFWRS